MSLSNKGAGVDPRLQSVTNALFLNASDDVVMRTHVEGLTLQTGDILVDAVKIWDGTHYVQLELPNNDNEAGGWSLSAETYNMVFNDATSSWDRLRGDATHGAWVNIKNSSIKVDQGSAGLTPWKVDIGSNGTVTANVTFPDYYKVSKNGSANATDNPIYTQFTNTTIGLSSGSATIGKVAQDKTTPWTVGLDAGTQTIGNVKIVDSNGAQNDSTHPVYVSGTVSLSSNTEVEIKNDTGNPIPVSRNTAANSLNNPIHVTYGIDTSLNNFTSKNRLKVSGYQVNFSHTYQFGNSLDFWDETVTNNGSASSVWDPYQSAMLFTVHTTQGSKIVRQSRQVMPYVPGRSASFSMAHEWKMPVTGIRARIGVFDENNGMYFEDGGDGTYYCVIRSNVSGTPTETRIARNAWNGDKFDGAGISGITALPGAIQLLCIDYEWYGAGQVIFSYIINGIKYAIHTFDNANTQTDVWCSTPFLPIRAELENYAGSTTSKQIWLASSSWSLEGDQTLGGVPMVIGHKRHNLVVKDTFYACISVRLKSNCLNAVNILKRFQTASETNNVIIKWQLIVNPTLTGAVWTDHPLAYSTMQYDISATSFSGGIVYNEGIAYNNADQFDFDPIGNAFQMARNTMGTVADIVTLAISSTTQNIYVDTFLRWREMR